jgi:hypothetical protein
VVSGNGANRAIDFGNIVRFLRAFIYEKFPFHFSIRDVAWSVVSNFGLSTVGVGRGIFSVGRIEL